jgi:hypothetical protein
MPLETGAGRAVIRGRIVYKMGLAVEDYHLSFKLIPEIFADKLYMDSSPDPLGLNHTPDVAESGRCFTIDTDPGFGARGLDVHANGIDRSRVVLGPGHGRFQVRNHLIHPHG